MQAGVTSYQSNMPLWNLSCTDGKISMTHLSEPNFSQEVSPSTSRQIGRNAELCHRTRSIRPSRTIDTTPEGDTRSVSVNYGSDARNTFKFMALIAK
jgi:hypothetical protein